MRIGTAKRYIAGAARGAARFARGPWDRRKVHIMLLVLYWPALFVVAHIPIPQVVYAARVSDKALHYVAYFILAFLVWFVISPHEKVNWLKKRAWLVMGLIGVYGALDEVIQGYVGRSCDVRDFLADVVGGVAALVICSVLSYWLALLAVTGVSIFALTNLARTNIYMLIPAGAIIFNILSYGLFAWVWIRNMEWFGVGGSRRVWPFAALSGGLMLLVIVEAAAIWLNRFWGIPAVAAAVAGIAVVVWGVYWKTFVRGQQRKAE